MIATSSYSDAGLRTLRSPAHDAADLAVVLGDPEVGGFEITQLLDKGVQELRVAVEEFLSGRGPEETVAVYVSCHGVLDARRRLYFAARDTEQDRLAATGLDARMLRECLAECRARRQVVILDCCFSGAFSLAKGSQDVGLGERFAETAVQGRGLIVLTASRATEHSFEGSEPGAAGAGRSVFTAALADGLRTGDADRDRDGLISVLDAYAYAYARIKDSGQAQTPQHWVYGGEGGEVILARSPRGVVVEPAALPDDLQASLESRYPQIRIAAVGALAEWLGSADPARAMTAREVLEKVAAADSPSVAQAARSHLVSDPGPVTAAPAKPATSAGQPRPQRTDAAGGSGRAVTGIRDMPQPPRGGGMRNMTQPRLVGGRYRLEGIVGTSDIADVFQARDIRLDRRVAVKALHDDLARDPDIRAWFRRGADSAASLNHKSIVAVYSAGEETVGGTPLPYIVMEFVDGDALREGSKLLPEPAAEVIDGVLRALAYSHRAGIVHRHLKPSNVMLTRAGDIKVTDFGSPWPAGLSSGHLAARFNGAAPYMSPEQARGERADARSDLYSAGCLLYELLTGQPPFTGDSLAVIAYQHVREMPVPPSRIDSTVPPWADAIALKAMAKEPASRYQSADDMRLDIQRALSGVPISAPMRPDTDAAGTDQADLHAIPPYRYGSNDQLRQLPERKPPWRFRKR